MSASAEPPAGARRSSCAFSRTLSSALYSAVPPTASAAAAVGAHAELDQPGVAVDDLDIVERHAQLVGHDLGEGRLLPLAVREEPVKTVTLPVGWKRIVPDSHRPAPAPIKPAILEGAIPQTSI